MTNGVEERLSHGYRVIRQMAGEGDSPWQGSLVCGPTGEMGVAVDATVLGVDWRGWDAAATGHVLGALDVMLRADGHDVMLPVCTERVEEFLIRRATGGADLSPGEGVTVAVSLLRGLVELHGLTELRAVAERDRAPVSACGSWWLTDAGRPVFATDTADSTVEQATVELLRLIGRDVPSLAGALADVIDASGDPRRLVRELERAEAALFAIAEPLALATTTFGPKRVREHTLPGGESIPGEVEPASPAWQLSFARHLDADWADLVSRTTTGLWRMMRARHPGGRRPWLVAGGLAGAILAGGLLWPTAPEGPATADVVPHSDAPVPSPSPAPAASPEADVPPPEEEAPTEPPARDSATDLASVAGALLTARTECAEESVCLEGILASPGARFPPGAVDLPPAERSVALLDEFGGAAVLRVEGAGAAPQLVVIVRADGRWLLRDGYDVAEQ